MTIDLHASDCAALTLVADDGSYKRVTFPGGTTVIVGDMWLTLRTGDHRAIKSADLSYRIATEADVLAWSEADVFACPPPASSS